MLQSRIYVDSFIKPSPKKNEYFETTIKADKIINEDTIIKNENSFKMFTLKFLIKRIESINKIEKDSIVIKISTNIISF